MAKHDYSDEREGNLSFLMGEQLYIISMSGDLCLARSMRTGMVGLIPSNYAAKWNDLESNAYVAVVIIIFTLSPVITALFIWTCPTSIYNMTILYYLHSV